MDARSIHKPMPETEVRKLPELLAPAGDWDCLKAAAANGANAVYFGLDSFNARMRAKNFTLADLPLVMDFLHSRGMRGYVTMNTLVFPGELNQIEIQLRAMLAAEVDAVIVQDMGLCRMIQQLCPDLPIHASTQMTITSAAGVEFARNLGVSLVVLARECSLSEIKTIRLETRGSMPLEVFVHGALCVAYSGQCLTSEALGGRSANRGECAQACRMPYALIQDGTPLELGDRHYLLSPQDLAGIEVLDELIEAGLCSLKIEGRLKSANYVANITGLYRRRLDTLDGKHSDDLRGQQGELQPQNRYDMEMAFSRGLHTGWLKGIDNQQLVHARFGKKRGVMLGTITSIRGRGLSLRSHHPIQAGDGIVIDQGKPDQPEVGGRIYRVSSEPSTRPQTAGRLYHLEFEPGKSLTGGSKVGDRVWKTSDPFLEKRLQQSYQHLDTEVDQTIAMEFEAKVGKVFKIIATLGEHCVTCTSSMKIELAQKHPLTMERIAQQLNRLGGSGYRLGSLDGKLDKDAMLPISELNRMRRDLVEQLDQKPTKPKSSTRWPVSLESLNWPNLEDSSWGQSQAPEGPLLIALVRNLEQLEAILEVGLTSVYCDFENPKKYREAVTRFRQKALKTDPEKGHGIWLAGPRINKPGEGWILGQVAAAEPDGFLVRNPDQLQFFADKPCIADFSMNVANAWSAFHLLSQQSIARVTASYDLNVGQLESLLGSMPPHLLEITLHQHMPMFHMEHCVFCAFMSSGKDYRDCGRPCEKHQVELKDRVGQRHPLVADVGCRNTVYNGRAQTGSEYASRLMDQGARFFRIEFLRESPAEVRAIMEAYQALIEGRKDGTSVWRDLKLVHQLGVTRGTMETRGQSVE